MACPYLIIRPDGKPELEDDGEYKYGYGCDDDPKVIEYNKMLKEIRKKAKKYYNNVLEEYYLVLIILKFSLLKFNELCTSSKELDEAIEKYDVCEKMLNHYFNMCDITEDCHKYYDNISFLLDTYINDTITQNYHICKCMYKFQNMIDKVNCQYIPYYKFINFVNLYEATDTGYGGVLSKISKIKKLYLINYIPKILSILKKSNGDENTINIYRCEYNKYNADKYEIFFRYIFNCFLDEKHYTKILSRIESTSRRSYDGLPIYTTEIVIFNMKNIKQFVPPPTFYEYLGLVENDYDFCQSIFKMFITHGNKIEIEKRIFTINSVKLLD